MKLNKATNLELSVLLQMPSMTSNEKLSLSSVNSHVGALD